ncbi:hypothetical protein K435DRAFT_867943 [Dendrothele bispora CBS 962.96]|uniref:Uncharacterized protein n=1 Tax=Dendrothele bispora (strain CBS 962.96) TaxID=1314807 RepID=A0A4S8LCX6_DENBC|nr:hypothetical protein K435DRAFT_867943 [Dendrothele bispora CBS 962.96]
MARVLGIHRNTLATYLKDYDITSHQYSNISDADLDQIIRDFRMEHPQSGIRYLKGHLRKEHSLRIQREHEINNDCHRFCLQWNGHPISGEGNRSPDDLRLIGKIKYGLYEDCEGVDPVLIEKFYGVDNSDGRDTDSNSDDSIDTSDSDESMDPLDSDGDTDSSELLDENGESSTNRDSEGSEHDVERVSSEIDSDDELFEDLEGL